MVLKSQAESLVKTGSRGDTHINTRSVRYYLPYRGKIRRGKVTKFSLSDEMFPRQLFFPGEIFPDQK